VVRIDGKINENLYPYSSFQEKDEKYYDNPAIREGTITKNETKVLSAGEEYTVSVLPTEVVVLHILSSNGEDVEIAVYRYGREKKYFIGGSSKLGFSIAFQNN
jgi:hypothetical protein